MVLTDQDVILLGILLARRLGYRRDNPTAVRRWVSRVQAAHDRVRVRTDRGLDVNDWGEDVCDVLVERFAPTAVAEGLLGNAVAHVLVDWQDPVRVAKVRRWARRLELVP